jgi:hypothetical protein
MKFIDITADFKHDGQEYWAGERRKLPPELCGYFCKVGWAGEKSLTKNPEPVTLEVHSGKHGTKSRFPVE